MKFLYLLALVLISGTFFTTSCNKQPTSIIAVSDSAPIVDQVLTFASKSENAFSYNWDFGDGTTSNLERPTHAYTVTGTYTVTLTAFSKNHKKTDETSIILNVNATSKQRLLGIWDYDSLVTTNYINGTFDSKSVSHFDQLFTTHTAKFENNLTYLIQFNADFSTGNWRVIKEGESIQFAGDTVNIKVLNSEYFQFTDVDTATVDGDFHLQYNVGYMSK